MANPQVLLAVGDGFPRSIRVCTVTWSGTTTAGDGMEITDPVTGAFIVSMQTPNTATFLGIALGDKGIGCPNGYRLSKTTAGTRVLVYAAE